MNTTKLLLIGALATGGVMAAAIAIGRGGAVQLSPHLSLSEMVVTSAPVPNIPGPDHIANLAWFAKGPFEAARAILGLPIRVTSGYRSSAVQAWLRTQGYNPSATSDHLQGLAMDFTVVGMTARGAYDLLRSRRSEIPGLDQLIYYDGGDGKGRRLHLGARISGGRNQAFEDSHNG